ncbi:MAG: acetyl-CoA carboxylase carboxyltransferase subunit beta [Nitrospirae bacterium]|nr:acetyl-CoA carboxylase carboxyltransferase subunit beta [Nitrospirota bacterium]
MAWFKRTNRLEPSESKRVKIPEGLWVKCNNCRELIYRKELGKNFHVCPKCDYHFPISVEERIALILDENSFKELDFSLESTDPLNFKDVSRYRDRLKLYQEKTGQKDSYVYGDGLIVGQPVIFGCFNFSFMGGSMGCVVGEKIVRSAERSVATRLPLIIVSSSGGARMQEGIYSLMQMVKTSAAVAKLHESGVPFISILTDPTFGGVTASFSMLGDIHIAEPKALIGFTGPRVIEQTLKQQLPEGFQRSEFLMEHGMLDMIVERKNLKETLGQLIAYFQ